jgi:hypothetical protein
MLAAWGPTLLVDIGFDPNYKSESPFVVPKAGISGIHALVDTGAGESCIDSLLAGQLNLPIVDRRPISGVHGTLLVNMYLAQIHVPSLLFTIHGAFAGVELAAGGQVHKALIWNDPSTTSNCFLFSSFFFLGGSADCGRDGFRWP